MTIEALQALREDLVAQLAEPSEIHIADRGMTNRSPADINRAIQVIDAQIAAKQTTQPVRHVYCVTDSGF